MNKQNFLKIWFLLAILTTAISLLIYTVVQQDIRQGANDPQIQMAFDTGSKLTQGVNISKLVPSEQVSIGSELSPFIIIYDYNFNPIAGNGIYDHNVARIPKGVLNYAKEHGEDRVTWQPDKYTRIALVVEKSGDNKSLVAVGRSMREIEVRENRTFGFVVLAWLMTVIITLIIALAFDKMKIFNR